ncbi:DUF6447 family protein [Pseudomonas sp. NW5]|uniref:DUF6447 family protein n=1 Tax=Pseudomonas sp. NW5 TaxID=2934934 RepID=UPI002020FA79|nr:DUF6447 family protein [Pseudomonas sp. NW5]MCL7461860.1 DUF6447 family protein [Pseudomonas sp. NW5]
MSEVPSITLNGKTYALADLNEAARNQLANIRVVDAEIVRLQQQLAITQTARNAYVAALTGVVEQAPEEAPVMSKTKTAVKAGSKKA